MIAKKFIYRMKHFLRSSSAHDWKAISIWRVLRVRLPRFRFFITLFIADLRSHNPILIFVTSHCHDCIISLSLRTCEYMFTYQFVISTKLCICFIKLCWYMYVRECISRSLHTFSCVAIVAAISRKIKNPVRRLITWHGELMLLLFQSANTRGQWQF